MEQAAQNLECQKEDYEVQVSNSNREQVFKKIQEKAINEGFSLSKMTGNKTNSFYFSCHRGGKPRETQSQGKRAKPSKKIRNPFIY